MSSHPGCSLLSEGGTSKLDNDGERLLLRCDASGVRRPFVAFVTVASSRATTAAAPSAFRFKVLDSVAALRSAPVRPVMEPGGGRSSMYAWMKCRADESSSRSCHEQTARGGTKGSLDVRQRTKN
jgi:hypothetical protein